MIEVPDPPEASRIRVEREHATVALSWRARPWDTTLVQRAVEYLKDWTTGVLILVWIAWLGRVAVGLFVPALSGGGAVELVLVCLVGGSFVWASYDRFRRQKRFRPTERLVLGEDTLIHTPSARRSVPPYRPPEEGSELARPGGPDAPPPSHTWPSAFVHRRDAGDVRLAGKGLSEIITLASADGEFTVGRRLPHADREWLVTVLKSWKDSEA